MLKKKRKRKRNLFLTVCYLLINTRQKPFIHLYMLQLQITSLLLFNHKFCCLSSSLHRMNKGKTPQRLNKLTHLSNPTKTIENSIKVKRKPKRKNNSKFQANGGMIPAASQSPSSLCYDKWAILGPDFYQIDALELAPRLLGKFLKKDDVVLQITEVIFYFLTFPFLNGLLD